MKKHSFIFFLLIITLLSGCTKEDGPDSTGFSIESNVTSAIDVNYDQDRDSDVITLENADSYNYKLPVIFHVIYNDNMDNKNTLTTQRLSTILGRVNELWKGGIYNKESVDMNVEFVMATHNEKGQKLKEPGVEYIKYTEDSISYKKFMADNHTDLLWDPNNYINVFLFSFKNDTTSGTVLGASNLPFTNKEQTLDGLTSTKYNSLTKTNLKSTHCVTINSNYSSSYNDSQRFTSNKELERSINSSVVDISATLAHELGHYLGLLHAFTENEKGETMDDCFNSDYCDDTKDYNKKEYEHEEGVYLDSIRRIREFVGGKMVITLNDYYNLVKRKSCDGTIFDAHNLMDYSFNNSDVFTEDQKKRVRHTLYYSPLIPGPKINNVNKAKGTRAADAQGVLELPVNIRE